MAMSAVESVAVRSVCGAWFVVRQLDGLPICPECERRQPVVQRVLDVMRNA